MKTIIFDMHGVIMKDPEGSLMPFVNKFFPHKTYENTISPIWSEASTGMFTSHEFLQKIGFQDDLYTIEKNYLDTIEFDKGFIECAEKLKTDYRLALLSNDISEWNLYLRNKYDLDKFFDVIVISGDVGMKKPFTDIFEYTLRQLNQQPSDCFFIDDRLGNLTTAEIIGIKPIYFNQNNIEYTGESVTDFDDLLKFFNRIV